MPQSQQSKNYYTFSGGLNTEVSPLNYPDDTVVEISNMDLLIDGSIRRRKGLTPETSATFKALHGTYTNGSDVVTEHIWRNAGGDSDSHLWVVQAGTQLYFFDDDATTLTPRDETIDLTDFVPQGATWTAAQIARRAVDITWGRGHALIVHRHLTPFYIEYDVDTDVITSTQIDIRIRDFVGVDDGVSDDIYPTSLTDAHKYNIMNQGWSEADITAYQGTQSQYPAKKTRTIMGYLRALTASTSYDFDGVRSFSGAKLDAEKFPNAPAPMGHFKLNPFDTTAAGNGQDVDITTWSISGTTAGTQTITITTSAVHGYVATDVIAVSGQNSVMNILWNPSEPDIRNWSFDGVYTVVSAPTTTTLTFTVTFPDNFSSWNSQYQQLGQISGGIENDDGVVYDERPSTVAFFAGRAWYAGLPRSPYNNTIFFSQVVLKNAQYGRCYQENDPTDELVPDLIESDGGVIPIPEAGNVIKLQPFGQSMLVFCDNGVWEIDGGSNRYFDAVDYAVRRITQVGLVARESVVEAENQLVYTSDQGAYRIFVDPQARVLISSPITEAKYNAGWAAIDSKHKRSMKTLYDPVRKRVLWLYDTTADPSIRTWNYTRVTVYDVRLDAFYTYDFPVGTAFATDTYVKGFIKPELFTRDGETIIKYLTWTDGSGFRWCEMTEASFSDLGEVDAAAHFITGYDHMGDASKDKQVKYLTTFMERIEDSSLTLQPRWDFAESSITGKFDGSKECYRHPRVFIGDGEDEADNGYPVVFSKHNVRGQGLVLALKFSTTAAKDAHIYGWSIDWQGVQSS